MLASLVLVGIFSKQCISMKVTGFILSSKQCVILVTHSCTFSFSPVLCALGFPPSNYCAEQPEQQQQLQRHCCCVSRQETNFQRQLCLMKRFFPFKYFCLCLLSQICETVQINETFFCCDCGGHLP